MATNQKPPNELDRSPPLLDFKTLDVDEIQPPPPVKPVSPSAVLGNPFEVPCLWRSVLYGLIGAGIGIGVQFLRRRHSDGQRTGGWIVGFAIGSLLSHFICNKQYLAQVAMREARHNKELG
eukprot:TRINITY_DN11951_c0_g1_i2.p1 TRINITY_DN11951_c0_g1~~TRINITY_DN11951_c0_g1_i2.p1  ORF type:complete len:121 (+),score=17.62 TRINITY_DN11951_c0_g1_i2:137-499(+)